MSNRRSRRRRERERARHAPRVVRRMPALTRLGLLIFGLVLIAGGVALLASGGPGTAERLGRVAGILIIVGLVLLALGAIGRV